MAYVSTLEQRLIEHEGEERFVYTDSLGYQTIGIGRCVDKKRGKGLSNEEILYLLRNDIKEARDDLSPNNWYLAMDDIRRGVIIEMSFNLGYRGLLKFKKMIKALTTIDYAQATKEMRDSLWAKQIGYDRLEDMCYRMEFGKYK